MPQYKWITEAVRNDDMESLEYMLEHGHEPNETDQNYDCGLIVAARNGNVKAAEILLRHGACSHVTDQFFQTGLALAVGRCHVQVVRLLLKHGAGFVRTSLEKSLYLACGFENPSRSRESYEIARLLLDHGASVNTQSNSQYTSPLNRACISGAFDIVKLLVEKGADVNRPNGSGFPPLFCAISGEIGVFYYDILRYLLSRGADPTTLIERAGIYDIGLLIMEIVLEYVDPGSPAHTILEEKLERMQRRSIIEEHKFLLRRHSIYGRYNKTKAFIAWAREVPTESLLHKDYLPLDMFRLILEEAFIFI